jgi:hypothetical protein
MQTEFATWEITLPDGTHVLDEIEYAYVLSVAGIQQVPQRNRRSITHPDGEMDFVAVPENYEENRKELEHLVSEWAKAEKLFESRTQKREELYLLYKTWLSEHLNGNVMSNLLFASAAKVG